MRVSPDQESITKQVGFLEDLIGDIEDSVGMAERGDMDPKAWMLVDRLAGCASRLFGVELEVRGLL